MEGDEATHWIIDTYRHKESVVAWYKDNEGNNEFHEHRYETAIYVEKNAFTKRCLQRGNINHTSVIRQDAYNAEQHVFRLPVPRLQHFERFVKHIEQLCKYDAKLYNADIPPAQRWLYEQGLRPYDHVRIKDTLPVLINRLTNPDITQAHIDLETKTDTYTNKSAEITCILFQNEILTGTEKSILQRFKQRFNKTNPDAVLIPHAFRKLPHIVQRCKHHNVPFSPHRSHHTPITYRGGNSFSSYGNTFYRDYGVRLRGRLLIDTKTFLGETGFEGVQELVKLSGTRTQHLASKSFGSVTQGSLVRELVENNKLVPHKHKPVSQPMRLDQYVQADKGGHHYDPHVGVHSDVAAIDFSSMFPNLICKYNICAESILSDAKPRNHAPNIPVSMHTETGLLANVLQPIMNRREAYKAENPEKHSSRIASLKGVLVSSYGYLRYREFKMGLAEAHMAICAYARKHLIQSSHIAERHGFKTVHGLVDSLYIKKKGVTKKDVKHVCKDIEKQTGLPITSDGILDWVAFLTSKTNPDKPVVTRYFGVYKNGETCIKGLIAVQKTKPDYIKQYQRDALQILNTYAPQNVEQGKKRLIQHLKKTIQDLPLQSAESLAYKTKIHRTTYKTNCVQKRIVNRLRQKGITVHPGHTVSYIHGPNTEILLSEHTGQINTTQYKEELIEALHELLQPFNFTKQEIKAWTKPTRQTTLTPKQKTKVQT